MKKIIAYLQGGLGNQCFIYAMARALSLRTKAELKFDARLFMMDKVFKRRLELHQFACELPMARTISPLAGKVWNAFRLKAPWVLKLLTGHFVETKSTCVSDLVFDSSVRLDGYWQSEDYFKDFADQILDDLKLKEDSWVKDDLMAKEIQGHCNSIFLHIRSYMEAPSMKDGSGALPISYFRNALKYLEERLPEGHVFVFSDNLAWAKDKFAEMKSSKFGFTYVEPVETGKISSQIRDFTLMRLCKHGVVANSSFSWWAGWLGERERLKECDEVIRIRPNRYVNNDHFWPERWVAVDE